MLAKTFCLFYISSFLFLPYTFSQSNNRDSLDIFHFNAGEKFLNSSKLDSALHHFNKASSLAQERENWETYIDCYNGRAFCHYINGDYNRAEQEMINAEKDARKYLSEDHQMYSTVLNNLGAILDEKGDFKNALKCLKKSAEIDLKTNTDKIDRALNFHNTSVAYRNIGDFDQSIIYEKKALQLRIDSLGFNNSSVASSQVALGHLYRDKNELDKALEYYLSFLDIINSFDESNEYSLREIIYCYQSMGKIFIKKQKYKEAYDFIQKALSLGKKENVLRRAQSYEVLGDWYMTQNKYKEAIDSYTKSKTFVYNTFRNSKKNKQKARILKNIAKAHIASDNIDSALYFYQAALIDLAIKFEDKDIYSNPSITQMISKYEGFEILSGKSEAFLIKHELTQNIKDLSTAFDNFQFTAKIIQDLRNNFITEGSKNELAEKSLSIYEGGIKTAFLLFQKTKEEKYLRAAWNFAEQNKARLLEESLQEDYARLAGGLPKDELETEQQLRQEINFFEKKINQEKGKNTNQNKEKIKIWDASLFDLTSKHNELIERFEQDYPKYFALKYATKNTGIDKIQSKTLTTKNALLEYFVGNESLYLFCLTKDDIQIFEFDKPASFTEDVATIRSIISQSPFNTPNSFEEDRKQFITLSSQLYNDLLKQGIEVLPKNITKLIFIPDDILAYLPFELLLMNEAKENSSDYSTQSCEYLFEQYDVSYNYSASLLAEQSNWTHQNNSNNFLGIAPSFDGPIANNNRSCLGENMAALKCNGQEVEAIHSLLGGISLNGITANATIFKEEAQQARILHLATHACIDEENPELNKIYFSDSYITSSDLYDLELNAELTVLSACNTGSGKLVKGEGVMSLSRAFILTGSSSTLMSLWSVDDCTTADIMLSFYSNLNNGLGKDKALKNAKLDYLSTADKVGTHPYYWAAFLQSGNAKPMNLSNGQVKYWILVFLTIPILLFFGKKYLTNS